MTASLIWLCIAPGHRPWSCARGTLPARRRRAFQGYSGFGDSIPDLAACTPGHRPWSRATGTRTARSRRSGRARSSCRPPSRTSPSCPSMPTPRRAPQTRRCSPPTTRCAPVACCFDASCGSGCSMLRPLFAQAVVLCTLWCPGCSAVRLLWPWLFCFVSSPGFNGNDHHGWLFWFLPSFGGASVALLS